MRFPSARVGRGGENRRWADPSCVAASKPNWATAGSLERFFNDASGGIWSLDPGGAAGPGVKGHWHRARRYGPVGMTQILGPIGIVTGSPTRTGSSMMITSIGSGAMDSSSDVVDEILHAPPGDEPDSQTQF